MLSRMVRSRLHVRRRVNDPTADSSRGATATVAPPSQRHARVLDLQRSAGNRAVRRLIQRKDAKPESKTLYMGLNPKAGIEAKKLRGVIRDDVVLAMNDPALEKSLDNEAGIARWLVDNLPGVVIMPRTFLAAYDFLRNVDPSARDSLAQVVKVFYQAEVGKFRLERIVLSGHSNGVALWGDEEGSHKGGMFLLDKDMERLTQAFPRATAQVQDIMFSACFSITSIDLVVKVFPNLETAWGYAEYSPAAGKGSEQHIAQWERETRGDKDLQRRDGRGTAALWSRAATAGGGRGYIRNDPADTPLESLIDDLSALWPKVLGMFEGDEELDTPWLSLPYRVVQLIITHPDTPADKKKKAEGFRDMILRMRYWDKITEKFATEHVAAIAAAYATAGINPPRFAGITRAGLKAHIEKLKEKVEKSADPDLKHFFDHLLMGLWNLRSDVIPETWI